MSLSQIFLFQIDFWKWEDEHVKNQTNWDLNSRLRNGGKNKECMSFSKILFGDHH